MKRDIRSNREGPGWPQIAHGDAGRRRLCVSRERPLSFPGPDASAEEPAVADDRGSARSSLQKKQKAYRSERGGGSEKATAGENVEGAGREARGTRGLLRE